jgi:2-oxoglutarate ferredoxin oxidoreductase subunit beta
MINNAVYGATGGQAAPTTLLGQKTTSYVDRREAARDGYPVNMAELIATTSKHSYVARVALNNVRNIMNAKKSIKRAFETQQAELGFSFVEMLSACPIGWHMTPLQSLEWIEEQMIPQYPLGEIKVPSTLA